jgi:hypothetical protein
MKLKVMTRALALLIILGLMVSALLYAQPTNEERQQAQNMINNGNALRSRYEQERQETIDAVDDWFEDQLNFDKLREAATQYGEMEDAKDRLQENRDSTIAYVDSVFDIENPGADIQYDPDCTDYGYTSSRCYVRICEPAFESPDILASTKIHEYEHVRQKKAGRWGPGNVPQPCTFDFHSLEFDAYEAEMDADFGGQTTLPLDEKLEVLRRKLDHLEGMIDDVAAQFEGDKVKRALPGDMVEKPLTVVNDSDSPNTVSGRIDDQQGWNITPPGFELYLDAEQETTFTVLVEVPPTAEFGGNEVMCHLLAGIGPARARYAAMQTDSARAFFFVNVIPSVDVVSGGDVSGLEGDLVDFYFTVVNEGPAFDTFDVELSSTLGWPLGQSTWNVGLNPGESVDLWSTVTVPPVPGFTTDMVFCTATSVSSPVMRDSTWLSVLADVPAGVADRPEQVFALMQNAPNPFRGMTGIRFSIPASSPVDLKVYDVQGRLVKTLMDGRGAPLGPGVHNVNWDGTDDGGRRVASGVYFYKLEARDRVATRKMVILR